MAGGAASADWPNWNGSADGAVTLLQAAGGRGAPNVTGISSTKALLAFTAGASNNTNLVMSLATRDGASLSESASVNVVDAAVDVYQKPSQCRMSDDRAVVAYRNNTDDKYEVSIIDTSGSVPSVVATAQAASVTFNTSYVQEVVAFSETLAILDTGRDIVAVDITGDSITFGTASSKVTGFAHAAVTKLSATEGVYLNNARAVYFSVSGTNITQDIANSYTFGASNDREVVAVSETEIVVLYEIGQVVTALPLTWTGSGFDNGSTLQIFDDYIYTMENNWAWSLDGRDIMVAFQSYDTQYRSHAFVVSSDESHALSKGSDLDLFTSRQVDHPCGSIFPDTNGVYGIVIGQEETTSPVKQVAARVVKG